MEKPSYEELENMVIALKNEAEILKKELLISRASDRYSAQTIMDSIPGYAFIKDIELKYVNVNQTFCSLANLTYAQIIGKCDYELSNN